MERNGEKKYIIHVTYNTKISHIVIIFLFSENKQKRE